MADTDFGGSESAYLGADDTAAGGGEATSTGGVFEAAANFLLGFALSNVCRILALHFIWPGDKNTDATVATISTDKSDGNGGGETNHRVAAPSSNPNNSRSPSPGPAPSPNPNRSPEKKKDHRRGLKYFSVVIVVLYVGPTFAVLVARIMFGLTFDEPWEWYMMAEANFLVWLAYLWWKSPRPWHKFVLNVLGLGLRASGAGLRCVARVSGRLAFIALWAAGRGAVGAAGLLLAKAVQRWETVQRDNPNSDGGGGEEPDPEPVPSPPIQIDTEPPSAIVTPGIMKPSAGCLPGATNTPEIETSHVARRRLDRSCRSPTHTVLLPPVNVPRMPLQQRGGAGSIANGVDGDRGSALQSSLDMTKSGDSATDTKIVWEKMRSDVKRFEEAGRFAKHRPDTPGRRGHSRAASAPKVDIFASSPFQSRPATDGYLSDAPASVARGANKHVTGTPPGYKIFRFSGGPGSPQAAQEAHGMDSPQAPTRRVDHMDIDQAVPSEGMESTRRPLVDQGSEVHCCTVDPLARKEMWIHAQYFEDMDGEAVPGVFAYLPVTVLRPSFSEFSTDRGRKWYVQPGGRAGRKEWSQEEGRIIWEVPQAILFSKVPAKIDESCDMCHRKGRQCNWTPDMLECLCDYCADAPRRHLDGCGHARDLGFSWARACDCLGE